MVVSGLVGTTSLQEDGGDVLRGERLTVHDLNVHTAAIENLQDISLLNGDTSLLQDRDRLTNPGESDELVALGDGGSTVINTLDEEGAEGDLAVIESGSQTGETILTGGLDFEGLAPGTAKVEQAPVGGRLARGNLVPSLTEGIIVSVDVDSHAVICVLEK